VYTAEILLTAVGLRLLAAAPRVTFLVAHESSHKNSSVTKTLREVMTSLAGYGTLSIENKSSSNNISMILPLLSIVWNEQLHFAVIRDCEAHLNLLQQQNSQLHKNPAYYTYIYTDTSIWTYSVLTAWGRNLLHNVRVRQ
jgi:hypothetical protein